MMSLERALMVPTLMSIFINELGKVLHKVTFADWTELFRKVKIIKLKTDHKDLQNYIVKPNCWHVQRSELEKNNPDINYNFVKRSILELLWVVLWNCHLNTQHDSEIKTEDYQAKTAFGYLYSKTISMMFPHSRFCMLLWLPLMYRKDINKQGEWSEVYHGFQTRT